MDNLSLWFAALILVVSICSGAHAGNSLAGQQLVVMTFNIRHGCGRASFGDTSSRFFRSCRKHLVEIVDAIRSAAPDVVGLQEVDEGIIDDIARGAGLHAVFQAHNGSGYGSWWGNALLSRYPIAGISAFPIGGIPGKNRSALVAKVLVGGDMITVANVHTQNRQKDDVAVQAVRDGMGSEPGLRIVLGDFNMEPADHRLEVIRSMGMTDTARAAPSGSFLGTYDSGLGRRIDYVFVDTKNFEPIASRLIAEEHREASDHIGYVAVVKRR